VKITMSYEDESTNRTISADEPMQIEDIVLLFKSFLIVVGYHPDTVNDWIDPHGDTKVSSDE
jgi:hypothetical protein